MSSWNGCGLLQNVGHRPFGSLWVWSGSETWVRFCDCPYWQWAFIAALGFVMVSNFHPMVLLISADEETV